MPPDASDFPGGIPALGSIPMVVPVSGYKRIPLHSLTYCTFSTHSICCGFTLTATMLCSSNIIQILLRFDFSSLDKITEIWIEASRTNSSKSTLLNAIVRLYLTVEWDMYIFMVSWEETTTTFDLCKMNEFVDYGSIGDLTLILQETLSMWGRPVYIHCLLGLHSKFNFLSSCLFKVTAKDILSK